MGLVWLALITLHLRSFSCSPAKESGGNPGEGPEGEIGCSGLDSYEGNIKYPLKVRWQVTRGDDAYSPTVSIDFSLTYETIPDF